MESLSMLFSSPPIKNHQKPLIPKPSTVKSHHFYFPPANKIPTFPHFHSLAKSALSLTTVQLLIPLHGVASEIVDSSTDLASNKIDLEFILVSVDEFFNRNPLFVAGCTFIWLVVIPLTESYLKKCKFISAIDAFYKLRDNGDVELLDIRDGKSLDFLRSPNLKILKKSAFQVEFKENDEDGFVKNVKEVFSEPKNTALCILDNFDGNSMRAAELLFNSGFREAYAISGGVRGKKGWLSIQETLLPPSVHIYPKKKVKISKDGGVNHQNENKEAVSASPVFPGNGSQSKNTENGNVKMSKSYPKIETSSTFQSPYPNYPDLKPPSSPTPSKP